jgi:hypothetical protein
MKSQTPKLEWFQGTPDRPLPIRVEGPDFICIGMIKAGTGWLFDQLRNHPDFWMPPVKEIRYLIGDAPKMSIVKKRWNRLQVTSKKGRQKPGLSAERNRQFLHEAIALSGHDINFESYRSLFRHKDGLLSGDISPIYSRLSDGAVSRIGQHFPDAKIILLIRDPVARAWSGISMLHRHGKFDATLLEDAEEFRAYLNSANERDRRAFPSDIVQRWRHHAPDMQFRYFFFDDIQDQPEKARREILAYLAADPEKAGTLAAGYNRKASAKKLILPDRIREVLVDHFADELRACATVLGGHANEWVTKYGL